MARVADDVAVGEDIARIVDDEARSSGDPVLGHNIIEWRKEVPERIAAELVELPGTLALAHVQAGDRGLDPLDGADDGGAARLVDGVGAAVGRKKCAHKRSQER